MKIIIGKTPNEFQVIGNSGRDITDEVSVKSLEVTVDSNRPRATIVSIDCYSAFEVEFDIQDVEFTIEEPIDEGSN